MARDTRRGDAPTIYPLGHPRNPNTAAAPAARRVPTEAPGRTAQAAAPVTEVPDQSSAPVPAPGPAPAAAPDAPSGD